MLVARVHIRKPTTAVTNHLLRPCIMADCLLSRWMFSANEDIRNALVLAWRSRGPILHSLDYKVWPALPRFLRTVRTPKGKQNRWAWWWVCSARSSDLLARVAPQGKQSEGRTGQRAVRVKAKESQGARPRAPPPRAADAASRLGCRCALGETTTRRICGGHSFALPGGTTKKVRTHPPSWMAAQPTLERMVDWHAAAVPLRPGCRTHMRSARSRGTYIWLCCCVCRGGQERVHEPCLWVRGKRLPKGKSKGPPQSRHSQGNNTFGSSLGLDRRSDPTKRSIFARRRCQLVLPCFELCSFLSFILIVHLSFYTHPPNTPTSLGRITLSQLEPCCLGILISFSHQTPPPSTSLGRRQPCACRYGD